MMPMQLRQFELRSAIASGGMGTVYRAFDTTLHREVAVKLMKKELTEEPQAMESFCREARAAASLNHINIIHIYNPDIIILGGGVMQIGRMLMEPALRIVQERTMKAPRDSARIALAQLTRNAGLVGAGALIYTNSQNT